jgi:hypothetical protein
MRIDEITQRLPMFQVQLKINGSTVTSSVQAANITQARMLLQHLYGAANIVSLTALSSVKHRHQKTPPLSRVTGF